MIQQWEETSDRRAIFLNCYMLMTQSVLEAIEAGEFKDSIWVRALLHRFAGYYFEALGAYELDSPSTPAVWRLTHDAAREPKTLVLQNLFLGVNAHINYDLVLTLVDMLELEWRRLSADQREQRYSDHCHVNQIIKQTINAVQDVVVERYSPVMDVVDKILGPGDEWLTAQVITDWRDAVWQEALQLLEMGEPNERQRRREQIEAVTLKRAKIILLI